MEGIAKIKTTVGAAPLGALIGAVAGYIVAKGTGFHKTLLVISFTVVGTVIGASIGNKLKK